MTEYETIKFEPSGAITRITLNRPDAANGMNDTMTRELADAARRCDTAATKVVVLTGIGSLLLRWRRSEVLRACTGPRTAHQGRRGRPAPRDLELLADGRRADHRRQRHRRRRRLLDRGDRRSGARRRVGVVHHGLHQGGAQPRRQLVLLPAAAHRHHQDEGTDADQPDPVGAGGVAVGSGHRSGARRPTRRTRRCAGREDGRHLQPDPTAPSRH